VELYMSRADQDENTYIFNTLIQQKEAIEARFGGPLEWDPLEGKKACRIKFEKAFDGYNKESWTDMIDFMVDAMGRLESAFKPPLLDVHKQLKGRAQ
jgi:hypothetical protein